MGFFSDLYGSKPSLPPWQRLDLGTEQQQAVSNNQAALPGAERLVGQANLFSQQQIDRMLQNAMPNYRTASNLASGNIESMLKGEVPLADQNMQQLRSVAKSFGGGYGGSGAMGNLVARDFGLQQMQLQQQGLNSLESWMSTAAKIYEPSMMNVSSMFVSPMQQAGFDTQERNAQFQYDYLQAQLDAAPDPLTRGLWNFGSSLGGLIGSPGQGLGSFGQNAAGMLGAVSGLGGLGGVGGLGMGGGGYNEMLDPNWNAGDTNAMLRAMGRYS